MDTGGRIVKGMTMERPTFVVVTFALLLMILSAQIVPDSLALVLIAAFGLLERGRYIMPLLVMSYQLQDWLPFSSIVVLLLVDYLVYHFDDFHFTPSVICCLAMVLLGLLSLVDPAASVATYIRKAGYEFAIIVLLSGVKEKENIRLAMIAFCMTFFARAFIMLAIVIRYSSLYYVLEVNRFGYSALERYLPEGLKVANENELGVMAIVTIAFMYILKTKEPENKFDIRLYGLATVVALLFGLLTKSRTFVFCTAIFFVLCLIGKDASLNSRLRLALKCGILLFILYGFLRIFFSSFYQKLLARFMVADLSNGRVSIFEEINKGFFSESIYYKLFGFFAVNDYQNRLGVPAFHNLYQRVYVLHGFAGALLVVLTLFCLVKESMDLKQWRKNIIYCAPFVLCACAGMATNEDWLMFAFTICIMQLGKETATSNVPVDGGPYAPNIQKAAGMEEAG